MKYVLYIILCFLVGCASVMPADKDDQREMEKYQISFVEQSQGQVTLEEVQSIPIYIKPYKKFNTETKKWEVQYSGVVGTCYPLGPFTFITISEGYWYSNFDEEEREQLIFHELGHCLLHSHHSVPTDGDGLGGMWERFLFRIGVFKEREKRLKDFCPSSYMHPYTLGRDCIKKHKKYYMDELFNRTTRELYENGH